jgi:heme oxygenase
MEGSTLGGQILTRHFAGQLGVRPDAGCRYFAAYGENTGAMWRAFGDLVAKRPPSENDDMLSAAIATFERLGDWLSGGARAATSQVVTHEYV